MLAVAPGAAIKMNEQDPREVGGYLVVFGSPQQTDLTGDYFDSNTDFGPARETSIWLNHTLPVKAGAAVVHIEEPIGSGQIERDERGVIIRALLDAKYRYLAEIASDLGWSSGTAAHLVRRVQVGAAKRITRWPLGIDASLTPTPAEPRTMLIRPASKTLEQRVEPIIVIIHRRK
jgi:hypothetical protein